MNIKKQLPNIITLMNLTAGLIAMVYVFDSNWEMAFFWVAMGIFFDFWDGFVARILKVQSELGLQLDSLADMITSGVVPGLAIYKMLSEIQNNQDIFNLTPETYYMGIVPYLGFIITLGSCMRLAKFNIDTRQSDSFIGLPTPANALFILSIPMILKTTDSDFIIEWLSNPYMLVVMSLISAYLMNAEIPLFSLKTKNKNLKDNKLSLFFLGTSAILLLFFQFLAVPIIIGFYIALSMIINATGKKTT